MDGERASTSTSSRPSRWDLLTAELVALRARAGSPSYAAISDRLAERRVAAGADEHAARVARSTVFDCFKPGRSRVNLALVREIAAVLGAEPDEVDAWVARSLAGDAEPQEDTPAESLPGTQPDTQPEHGVAGDAAPTPWGSLVVLVLACVGVNLLGRIFVDALHLPIYLDMVGTAIASIAVGPWWGVSVGLATNLLGVASSGPASIPFALVNVVGALTWGYGVRRLGLGRTLPRFLGLNLLVAGACSAVAVPLLLIVFGGSTGHGEDTIQAAVRDVVRVQALALAGANLLVSVADKVISGFVALVVATMLPPRLRSPEQALPVTAAPPRA